jgi:hypothetical protein
MSDLKDRLAKAREEKAKRDKAAEEARDAAELQMLELDEHFSKELGARGLEFEIVGTALGPVVLKRGEAILQTRLSNSKMTDADVVEYITPCVVHPAKEAFLGMLDKQPLIANRCALALATLFGAKANDEAGKY